jgi:capsular polysaccharide transport system permease protein
MSEHRPPDWSTGGPLNKLRVLEALAVRDMMMRYGRGNLGFLWVLLEPMILTIGVMLIWTVAKGEQEHGIEIIAFVLTGYMPLTLWRHMTNGGVFLLRRNSALLYHRNISLFDVFVGRMVLEFAGTTAALIVVSGTLIAIGLVRPPQNIGLVALGWVMMGAIAFSCALFFCIATEYSEIWERFVQPFQYLMLPLSGCFYMVDWLPASAQDLMLLNPTVHCFEAFRAGYLGSHIEAHYWPWYPFLWSLGLLALGLRALDATAARLRLD